MFTPTGIQTFSDGTQQMVLIAEITVGDKNRMFSLDDLVEISYRKLLGLAEKI